MYLEGKRLDSVGKDWILDYNKNFLLMRRKCTYISMKNAYPFTQTRQATERPHLVQVKKVIEYDALPRFIIKEKIRMLKSLGFRNLTGYDQQFLNKTRSFCSSNVLHINF